jgi:hypothetical protein
MTAPDPRANAPAPAPWEPKPAVPAPDSPADRLWAAFIGPQWRTYRRKFTPFFEDGRFTPTWNWPAALFAPIWFLYRKLYLPFVFFWLAPSLVFRLMWRGDAATVPSTVTARPGAPLDDAALTLIGAQLAVMFLAGGTANYLLYRRGHAAVRLLAERGAPAEQALPLLGRVGGTNRVAVAVVLALLLGGVLVMARDRLAAG